MGQFKARVGLEKLEEYVVETTPDANIIVNANESNGLLPKSIVEKISERTKDFLFNRYPPMHPESILQVIGKGINADPEKIILGNGSSELLEKACYAFGGQGKKIAFPYPSFSMYGVYTEMADSIPAPYPLTKEGYVDADKVIEFCYEENPALLIICNPNNPTGNFNALENMEKILKSVTCPVIMDEAYMEFAEVDAIGNKLSTLSLLDTYENFLCLRTFSKAYGLAGMRLGYGTGGEELIKIMQKVLLPYHVNNFTLMVGEMLYQEKDFLHNRVRTIVREREKMAKALKEMGFGLFPSQTNFLMFYPEAELTQKLMQEGKKLGYRLEGNSRVMAGNLVFSLLLGEKILVRNFTKHPALPGAIRISIGLSEENEKIIATLTKIVEGRES